MTPAPQQVLRDALTAKCIQGSSPLQSLIELAQKAGVGVKTIAKASGGHPIPTVDHLRLCAAIELDPLAGIGPSHYGLQKRYPTPSTFDFGFFSMGFRLKQRLNRHSDRKACQVIGIKAGTLKRLKLAHALPIGPVLRACAYIGVHPFGYFAVQKILGDVSLDLLKSSETSPNFGRKCFT
jgi:hypothetical protein